MTDPTSHPEELLAAAVDGGLDDARRAELEAHLATCERCRGELRLARSAREALGALPEADVPQGTLRPVVRSIAERTPSASLPTTPIVRRERRRHDPTRVLAGLTVAAVLVILGGILVAPLLHRGGVVSKEAAGSAIPAPRAAPKAVSQADLAHLPKPRVQQQSVDYDGVSIQAAALAAAHDPIGFARRPSSGGSDASGSGAAVSAPAAAPSATDQATPTAGDTLQQRVPASEARTITDCVAQWARGKSIIQKNLYPLRIVHATYQGNPATIAVYLQMPSRGTPGKVLVWVLDSDCRLVSFVQRMR